LSNLKTTRDLVEQEQPVVELSSGQTVFAVAVLMIICIGCYMAGILTNKYQSGNAFAPTKQAELEKAPVGVQTSGAPITKASATEPSTNSPKPPADPTTKGPTPDHAVETPPTQTADSSGPRTVNLEPNTDSGVKSGPVSTEPPARTTPAPVPPDRPQKPDGTTSQVKVADATPAAQTTPLTKPVEEKPAAEVQLAPLDEPSDEVVVNKSKPIEDPKSKIPKQNLPSASGTQYGIQVQAFGVTESEKARAEALVKKLKTDHDLESSLVPSKDGKWLRAIVGRYSTQSDADQQREHLKSLGFNDCYVRPY
jgi:cell division protein FtsN